MTFRQKYLYGEDPIEINAGRRTVRLTVENTGDRAIQIGSHYHFFEVNSALSFDRQKALGMHLNIPAGTAVRVEPGGTREVELCAYAGTGRLVGFSGLLNGSLVSHPAKVEAVRKAIDRGFAGAQYAAGESAGPPEDQQGSAQQDSAQQGSKQRESVQKDSVQKDSAQKNAKQKDSGQKKGSH